MALLTNKLGISLGHEEFDKRYAVFEVTKEGKGRLSWSSRVFEAFGAPYILSTSVKVGMIRSISLPQKALRR